ncbi:hypothetical protein KM043_014283 [Ampulex compressa]|nr:hypothetical protein KM043_014283 [Ampulex compressa]
MGGLVNSASEARQKAERRLDGVGRRHGRPMGRSREENQRLHDSALSPLPRFHGGILEGGSYRGRTKNLTRHFNASKAPRSADTRIENEAKSMKKIPEDLGEIRCTENARGYERKKKSEKEVGAKWKKRENTNDILTSPRKIVQSAYSFEGCELVVRLQHELDNEIENFALECKKYEGIVEIIDDQFLECPRVKDLTREAGKSLALNSYEILPGPFKRR